MIAQFRTLDQVKRLRQDKALRDLEKARSALAEAEARAAALDRDVAQSAQTLPARERAVYEPVLRQQVTLPDLDEAKDEVLALVNGHRALCDRRDRALEFVKRCQTKLEAARAELRRRQTETEKIKTLLQDLIDAADAEAEAQEDAEIEDLFARPRRPAIITDGAS